MDGDLLDPAPSSSNSLPSSSSVEMTATMPLLRNGEPSYDADRVSCSPRKTTGSSMEYSGSETYHQSEEADRTTEGVEWPSVTSPSCSMAPLPTETACPSPKDVNDNGLSFLQHSSVSSLESLFLCSGPRLRVIQPRAALERVEAIIPRHHIDSQVEEVVKDAWQKVFVPSNWYWQTTDKHFENLLAGRPKVSQKTQEREEMTETTFVLPSSSFALVSEGYREHLGDRTASSSSSFVSSATPSPAVPTPFTTATPFSVGVSVNHSFASSSSIFSSSLSGGDDEARRSTFPFSPAMPRRKMVLPRSPHPLNPLSTFYPTRDAALVGSGYRSLHELVLVAYDKPMTIVVVHPSSSSRTDRERGNTFRKGKGGDAPVSVCIPGGGQKVFTAMPTSTTVTHLSIHPWWSAVTSTSEMVEMLLQGTFAGCATKSSAPSSSSTSPSLRCASPSSSDLPVCGGAVLSPIPAFVRAMPHPHSRNLYVLIDEVAPVDPFVDIDLSLPSSPSLFSSGIQTEAGEPLLDRSAGERILHDANGIHRTEGTDGMDPFAHYLERASFSVCHAAELALCDIIEFLVEQFEKILGTTVQYFVALSSSYCVRQKKQPDTTPPTEDAKPKVETIDSDHAETCASHATRSEIVDGKLSFHVHFRLSGQDVVHSVRELDILMRHVRDAAKEEVRKAERQKQEEEEKEEKKGKFFSKSETTTAWEESGNDFPLCEAKGGWKGHTENSRSSTLSSGVVPSTRISRRWRQIRALMVLESVDFAVYTRWRPFRLPYNVKAPTLPSSLHGILFPSRQDTSDASCPPDSLSNEHSEEAKDIEKRTQEALHAGAHMGNEIKGFYGFLERISPTMQDYLLRVACGLVQDDQKEGPTLPPWDVGSIAPQIVTEITVPSSPPSFVCSSSSSWSESLRTSSQVPDSSCSGSEDAMDGRDTLSRLLALVRPLFPTGEGGNTAEDGDKRPFQGAEKESLFDNTTLPSSPPSSSFSFPLDWDAISLLLIHLFLFRFRCLLPLVPPTTRCHTAALFTLLTSYSPFRYSEAIPQETPEEPSEAGCIKREDLDCRGRKRKRGGSSPSPSPSRSHSPDLPMPPNKESGEKEEGPFTTISPPPQGAGEVKDKRSSATYTVLRSPSLLSAKQRRSRSSTLTPLSINILFHMTMIQRSGIASFSTSSFRLLTVPACRSQWKTTGSYQDGIQNRSACEAVSRVTSSGAASFTSSALASSPATTSTGGAFGRPKIPRKKFWDMYPRIPVEDIEIKRKIAQIFYALHPAFGGGYDSHSTFFESSNQAPLFFLPGVSSSFSSSCFNNGESNGNSASRRRIDGEENVRSSLKRAAMPSFSSPQHFSSASSQKVRYHSQPVVPELLRVLYQDCGVRSYVVRQRQTTFCMRLQRCHRATHTQLTLTYGSIRVWCCSNDCFDAQLVIPWTRPPPPLSSVKVSNVAGDEVLPQENSTTVGSGQDRPTSDFSSSSSVPAIYPQYERLTEIRKILFPELPHEEVQKRYKDLYDPSL